LNVFSAALPVGDTGQWWQAVAKYKRQEIDILATNEDGRGKERVGSSDHRQAIACWPVSVPPIAVVQCFRGQLWYFLVKLLTFVDFCGFFLGVLIFG